VADRLFATLDSTTRRLELPGGLSVVVTDTVGFISKLPHELVAAFKSTLDEVARADLLLHVIDASDAMMDEQTVAVERVLAELEADHIPRVFVYNKADRLDEIDCARLAKRPGSALISALDAISLDKLIETIEAHAAEGYVRMKVKIPYTEGQVRQWLYSRGAVISEEHLPDGSLIDARIKRAEAGKVEKYRE